MERSRERNDSWFRCIENRQVHTHLIQTNGQGGLTNVCMCAWMHLVYSKKHTSMNTHTPTFDRKRKFQLQSPWIQWQAHGERGWPVPTRQRANSPYSLPFINSDIHHRHISCLFLAWEKLSSAKHKLKNTVLIFRTSCSPIGCQWCHPVSYAIVNNLLESSVLQSAWAEGASAAWALPHPLFYWSLLAILLINTS